MSLVLRELADADLPAVDGWFVDPETRRWLGDGSWPRQLILLATTSTGRFAFAAVRRGVVVGIADVERYGDGRAAVAFVVAPAQRRLGIGKAMARALPERPELAGVVEFFGGVEAGNAGSAALMRAVRFEQVTEQPGDEGFTYFALRPDGSRPRRPWTLSAD